MKQLSFILISCLTFTLIMVSSCKNDNEEDLNPNPQQPATCLTDNVTYSRTISNIVASNCIGCHSAATASAGVVLDNHAGVKKVADNGKLLGTISHAVGFSPMPKGGTKLADCDIDKIKAWINNGAPNN